MFGWLMSCLGQQVGFPVPEGGAGRLTDALVSRLLSRGSSIQCGTAVTQVVVRKGRAVGVRTASGGTVDVARAVIADVSAPELYINLVAEDHLPPSLLSDLRSFQWDMSTLKVDWALNGPVPWRAPDAQQAGTVHVADDFDNFTEFSAQIAMGCLPNRPFLLFGQQSPVDPTRSPRGTDTAWAYTHVPRTFAPTPKESSRPTVPDHGCPALSNGWRAVSRRWLPDSNRSSKPATSSLPACLSRRIGICSEGPSTVAPRRSTSSSCSVPFLGGDVPKRR